MKSRYLLISRITGVFLSFSVLCILYYSYLLGVVGLLSYLIPSVISVTVFLLYFTTGVKLLRHPFNTTNVELTRVMLILQSIQIKIMGVMFKNYYGPYLGISFTDTPDIQFKMNINLFDYASANGYMESNEIIAFNLVPMLLLILLDRAWKKQQKNELDAFQ